MTTGLGPTADPDRPEQHDRMTAIVIEAPDQFGQYAVAALLEPYPEIQVLPAGQVSEAHVMVIVTSTLTAFMQRRSSRLLTMFRGPYVLIVDRVGQHEGPPARTANLAGLMRRGDLTPELLAARIQWAARGATPTQVDLTSWPPAPDPRATPLDDREAEILRLLAQGLEVSEIARRLGSSESSVKRILSRTMKRLRLNNRWQAVAYAFRADLI